MTSKTSTAKVTEQQENLTQTYNIGEVTKQHIAAFAEGIVSSGVVGLTCLQEALEVAATFPKWKVNNDTSKTQFKALGKAVKEELVSAGLKENSAQVNSVHFSNIVKVAQLKLVKVQTGKTKTGKPIIDTVQSAKFFNGMSSFTDAYHAAQKMLRLNGLSVRKERGGAAPKAVSKAELVDMLDKVIGITRVSADLASSGDALQYLLSAKAAITGTKLSKMKDANRAASIKASLVHAKKGMSRGQKAAATRRANVLKARRVAEHRVVH